jgi:hypothetical protein
MAKDILITPESGSLVFSGSTQPLSSSFVGDDSGSIVLHLEQTGSQNFTIEGSGSSLFNVDGTQGRLFSITDEMSGSIFSANTIAGLPVIEAFSDNQVKLGPFTNPVTIDSSGSVGIGATATDFHADADDLVVGGGSGNTGITIHSGTGGYGSIFFADGTADDLTEKRGQIRYLQGTERMDFHTDGVATAALSLAANGHATFGENAIYLSTIGFLGSTGVWKTDASTYMGLAATAGRGIKFFVNNSTNESYTLDSSGDHDFKSGTATFGGDIYLSNKNLREVSRIYGESADNLHIDSLSSNYMYLNYYSGANIRIGSNSNPTELWVQGEGGHKIEIGGYSGGALIEFYQGSSNRWQNYHYTDNSMRWNYNGIGNDEMTLTTAGALSLEGGATFGGDVTVEGILTAREFHTEFVSASILYESGSTKFGDTSDDIHSFSGSLRVTGSGDHYFTNGNVGIGTTSPGAKLDVQGADVGSTKAIIVRNSSGTDNFSISNNGQVNIQGSTNIVPMSGGSAYITIRSNSTGYMTVQGDTSYGLLLNPNGGNVGIGTTAPQSKLQVDGGIQMSDDTDTAVAGKVGTVRYRTSGNNSYVDMCMQTGASTYEWINIVQNNW